MTLARERHPAESMEEQTCVINIGPDQRRRRRRAGVVALLVGIALAGTVWLAGVGIWARLLAAPLYFGGFNGVFQARAKT